MDAAFDFIKNKGGLTAEDNYPYRAEDGNCDVSLASTPAVAIDGHEDVPANSENALVKAAANQPNRAFPTCKLLWRSSPAIISNHFPFPAPSIMSPLRFLSCVSPRCMEGLSRKRGQPRVVTEVVAEACRLPFRSVMHVVAGAKKDF